MSVAILGKPKDRLRSDLWVQKAPARPEDGDKPSVSAVWVNELAVDGYPSLEGVENLHDMFERSVKAHPDRRCLGHRPSTQQGEAGPYEWLTYKEVSSRVAAIASAMASLGLRKGGKCGVYGGNCVEWMLTLQACNRQALMCVPLYDSLGDDAVQYIVQHAALSIIVCSGEKFPNLLRSLEPVKGIVKIVVVWGKIDHDTKKLMEGDSAAGGLGVKVFSFDEFMQKGREAATPSDRACKSDLCTIMYTSGTTGTPKGVMLSHGNLLSTVAGCMAGLDQIGAMFEQRFSPDDVLLSYLPLAHIFDRALEELFLAVGGSIGYWRGQIDGLMEDILELTPTMFPGVPRVFERVFNGVNEKLSKASYLRQGIFKGAVLIKQNFMKAGCRWDKACPLADALVFSQVKERMGGRVRMMASGSAPLPSHIEEFLKVTFCAPVVQGYGLTETCGCSFMALPTMETVGTVGGPLPLLEYRLESIPDMKYNARSVPPQGEICIRGPTVFQGYYKQPELTAEVLDADGWFHTGDVGEMLPNGTLKIIDRKKSIFKLAQGEYIAPDKVEAALSKAEVVSQIFVAGSSVESSLVAVVVPEESGLRSLVGNQRLPFSELCGSPASTRVVLSSVATAAHQAGLKPYEIPKAVLLESEQWTVENGLQTPTYKLRRPALQAKYQLALAGLYDNHRKSSRKHGL